MGQEMKIIARIRTDFPTKFGIPRQSGLVESLKAQIVFEPEYRNPAALRGLDGFSHIYVLSHLHGHSGYALTVTPFLDTEQRGLFATRAPKRPNPIGLSVLRLKAVGEEGLVVLDVDLLDGTPVLDIKPYVPEFEANAEVRTGWLEGKAERAALQRSDGRFGSKDEG